MGASVAKFYHLTGCRSRRFRNNCHFTARFFAYAFRENLGMVAKFNMDQAALISGHWFQELAFAGLYRLVGHAPCQACHRFPRLDPTIFWIATAIFSSSSR